MASVKGASFDFKQRFLEQYPLRDFYLSTKSEFIAELKDRVKLLDKIYSSPELTLPVDFSKSNLLEQSKMLGTLLMDDEKGLALLLYSILTNKAPAFASMIKGSLHYSLQSELSAAEENFESMKERLFLLGMIEISIKRLIISYTTNHTFSNNASPSNNIVRGTNHH